MKNERTISAAWWRMRNRQPNKGTKCGFNWAVSVGAMSRAGRRRNQMDGQNKPMTDVVCVWNENKTQSIDPQKKQTNKTKKKRLPLDGRVNAQLYIAIRRLKEDETSLFTQNCGIFFFFFSINDEAQKRFCPRLLLYRRGKQSVSAFCSFSFVSFVLVGRGKFLCRCTYIVCSLHIKRDSKEICALLVCPLVRCAAGSVAYTRDGNPA